MPVSVRYRISGGDSVDWELVLSREGNELERRTVRGNGAWQYESFSFPATNAGVNLYQARLEVAREQNSDLWIQPSGSVTMELWNNVAGQGVPDLVSTCGFQAARICFGQPRQVGIQQSRFAVRRPRAGPSHPAAKRRLHIFHRLRR